MVSGDGPSPTLLSPAVVSASSVSMGLESAVAVAHKHGPKAPLLQACAPAAPLAHLQPTWVSAAQPGAAVQAFVPVATGARTKDQSQKRRGIFNLTADGTKH
jgi:hypothetical protein